MRGFITDHLDNDPSDTFLVAVRCRVCLERFGRGTIYGRLLNTGRWVRNVPEAQDVWLDDGWQWYRQTRTRSDEGKRVTGTPFQTRHSDFMFSDGLELKCRRCGAKPRVSFKQLTTEADQARTACRTDIYV